MIIKHQKPPASSLALTGLILAVILAIPPLAYAEQVTHSYDNLNRLIRTDYGNGKVVEYTYDAAGNRLTQQVIAGNQTPVANAGPDQTVTLGSVVTLNGSGSDPDNGPQPLAFAWTQPPGQTISLSDAASPTPTFTATKVGDYTFTLTVSDGEASASDQAAVKVLYLFSGFFPPVDNPPVYNTMKAGSAVPVRFSLQGNQGLKIFAKNSPSSKPVSCESSAASDPIDETVTPGKSELSYNAATDTYNYAWMTNKSWAGTCRQLDIRLIDGTSHTALFNFKR